MKNRTNRILIAAIIILTATTALAAYLNFSGANDRMALAEKAEILVKNGGELRYTLDMEKFEAIGLSDFNANLNSDESDPVKHSYTGAPLIDVLEAAGISLDQASQINILSADGYMVALTAGEAEAMNNVYLVIKQDGEYLGTIEDKDGKGPYMIVVRSDPFSQRWAKFVCEIDVI